MSSPATALYGADPLTVILIASAIQAAQAIQEGYRAAENLRQEHEQSLASQDKASTQANTAGQAALEKECDAAEKQYTHLIALSKPYGIAEALTSALPAKPTMGDNSSLAAYIEQIRLMSRKLEEALREIMGKGENQDLSSISIDEIAPEAAVETPPIAPDASVRLLARIASLGEIPEIIGKLAAELAATQNPERKKLVELELRKEIQAFQERAVEEASAVILEHTLKDLGYQVEPIGETLFVEGGVVHFRRPGWDNYLVRLRVDNKKASANFNVIRAVEKDSNEKSVMDHIAEDRWCAEFPAFMKALEAKGLNLQVTRLISPGEYPVQLVNKDLLPKFEEEKTERAAKAPLQRGLQ